jgi:hypothetical protein
MNCIRAFAAVSILVLGGAAALADSLSADRSKVKTPAVVALRARAFALQDVRLLDGPFQHAMQQDRRYLLSLEPKQLLHTFYLNARLPSSARPLGGWEEPNCELRGHFAGHYLTACAMMYASTGDERLKEKVDAMVAGMSQCQAKLGNGYLSAYPEAFFDRVEAQQRVWAPYYTLHKIYAGLLDAYVYCDNDEALEVCKRFGDWVIARNSRLSDEQMQKMLGNEHGGMNEVLANLYGLTGETKYLDVARRFNHAVVVEPAQQQVDKLTGLHANTQVPKFIGTARQYELTGDESLMTASTFFWNTVVNERSYCIGGHSDGEHFTPKEKLSEALSPSTAETCNTYNMLKLTRHLFCWNPRAEYADYYERALLNHILASQDPHSGGMCYFVPLRPGSRKTYNGPLDAFWCCTGTGIENHAKYGDSIYFHDGGTGLFVNLFIASELNWKAQGVKLRQETRFPDEGATALRFECDKPVELTIHLRRPYWARGDLGVSINGQPHDTAASKPGSYVSITRTWQSGDRIEMAMPFDLRTEGFRDNPRRFAFLHGPLVLGAEVDPGQPLPAIVADDGQILAALKPVTGKASTFESQSFFRIPGQGPVQQTLEPFFKIHGGRHYTVYWDAFSPSEWQLEEKHYEAELARRKDLDARTVDHVSPGHEQNERDHKVASQRSGTGDFGRRKFRHATDGGWFSWEVKVLPDHENELRVTYWGSDGNNRVFDILVDGEKLATQRLANNKPGEFYDEVYPLPAKMLAGKQRVTVKFQAHPNLWAGGVFDLRVMKKQ